MTKEHAALTRVGAAALALLCWGPAGCSSSSSSDEGGDATVSLDALPPLGIGTPDCQPDACPFPATCSGTLLGPNTPVSFCTLVCSQNSDCPSGTLCAKIGQGQCLHACTSNSDCSGGLGCLVDAGVCYSLYGGADAVPEAGAEDAPGEDASPGAEAGGPDGGTGDGSPAEGSTADGPAGDAGADATGE